MLSDDLKKRIQQAYGRFLESRRFRPRYGQRLMIAEVARLLGSVTVDEEGVRIGSPAVAAIEAGTGTGKTVAYCLAAIPCALASGKRLIIATATVALQEQIVGKDLPDLMADSGMDFSYTLAKGRGRYLCLSRLDALLRESEQQEGMAQLFAEEGFRIEVDEQSQVLYRKMAEALGAGRWDGDRDTWPEALADEAWSGITVSHGQCIGRHCPHFQQCFFYKAREGLENTDVVVTNHDMVLADLKLGGGVVLPAPEDSIYVFDEGHHLPDKAINHFTFASRLHGTSDWLEQMARSLERLLAQYPLSTALRSALQDIPESARSLRQPLQFLFTACEEVANFPLQVDREGRDRLCHRFPGGRIPGPVRDLTQELGKGFVRLAQQLERFTGLLKDCMDGEPGMGLAVGQAEEWYPLFGSMLSRAGANLELWRAFAVEDDSTGPPLARWLTLTVAGQGFDIEVCASPILAAEALNGTLWVRAYAAIVTSATLTALGSFDYLKMRAGLPESTVTAVTPSPFRHEEAAVLRVPVLRADPANPAEHTAEIIGLLPGLLAGYRGALVLFSSRRQMEDVFFGMDADWRESVLMQGNLSRQEMLRCHRECIDAGGHSVLFGLASFSEGVDLPGAYCEHVVIAKIPFAVPNDPVGAGLGEWVREQGRDPFMEITVPDAALHLVQACGRLLRSEQDRGVVTLLDRRIVTRRYGRAILDTLPPFRREID